MRLDAGNGHSANDEFPAFQTDATTEKNSKVTNLNIKLQQQLRQHLKQSNNQSFIKILLFIHF